MDGSQDYEVVLKKTTRFWPILLFPHHRDSNTIVFTGHETVRDVKFGVSSATLILTKRTLSCRLNVLRFLLLRVELVDITKIRRMDGKDGILEVHFKKADEGFVTRMALTGDPNIPRNMVFLNLGDEVGKWRMELRRRAGIEDEEVE